MAQLDIFRLLEISPDSSLREVKRAYSARRREIDPQLSHQIEQLDAAYEQALIWFEQHPQAREGAAPGGAAAEEQFIPVGGGLSRDVSGLFSPSQLEAMRTLGAVPGCNIDAAKRAAKRRGVPALQAERAARILHDMGGSPNSLHYAVQILWKLLAATPVLVVTLLYGRLAASGLDFFPNSGDAELSTWFSGMLLASTTVSVLFTLLVPILLILICRRITAGKRKCHRWGITPASRTVAYSFSAIGDLLILCLSLILCLGGPPFYGDAVRYWKDYSYVQTGQYETRTLLDLQSRYTYYQPDNPFYYDYITDDGQLLSSRKDFYLTKEATGYEQGYAHELTLSYLPNTGLVHQSQIHSYTMYQTYSDFPAVEYSYDLNRSVALRGDGRLEIYSEAAYDIEELEAQPPVAQIDLSGFLGSSTGVSIGEDFYLLFNEWEGTGRLICTLQQQNSSTPYLLTLSFDLSDGKVLGHSLLEDWQCQELLLLENGDFAVLAFHTLFDSSYYSSGAWVSALLLDGETFACKAMTADPPKLPSFYDYTLGTVNAQGIDISFETYEADRDLHLGWEAVAP